MLKQISIIFIISMSNILADNHLNVFNDRLEPCSMDPLTGYTRTGYCVANEYDQGSHFVCATVTKDFLDYTKSMGNDLSTPHPPHFPGLKPGDNWCLCVFRWIQAKRIGKAPPVVLRSTNSETLNYLRNYNMSIEDLQQNTNGAQSNLASGFSQAKDF